MRPLPPNYSSKRLSIWREFSGRSSVSRVWLPGMRRSAHPLLWRLPAAEPCARELRLRMPTMCFQLGRLPALDGQSSETGDDVCRGAPVCLQSPSTECAAPEACNAHYHATLQHSLPLRPRQQAPGHADLRQWQCRVSVQRETATSDDNLSNLRCWRNAGAHKQSPGPLATLE